MLANDLTFAPSEWVSAGQPLICNDGERILIAGIAGPAINLLRCHVGKRTRYIVDHLSIKFLASNGDTEVGQEYLTSFSQQHVFRLDVAVNHPSVVRVL